MFRLVKRIFVSSMIFSGCNLWIVNSLECFLMNNQECKVRPEIVNLNRMSLYFILLILKQVNVVVVVATSIIHMQNCVFLMLLKT